MFSFSLSIVSPRICLALKKDEFELDTPKNIGDSPTQVEKIL
jgi:hypothetical protein